MVCRPGLSGSGADYMATEAAIDFRTVFRLNLVKYFYEFGFYQY